jgi:DEAD/DEAH box helicase domain-containing protein
MLPASVAEQTRSTLLAYLRTTFGFRDAALERALFAFLTDPATGLFRGPFLDLRLPFRQAEGADVPLDIAPSFVPYAHQLRAFERLSSQPGRTPAPTLVTTGTGSGKTECFLYPILDHCFRHKGDKGIKAILLYPMNALATDQARRIAKQLASDLRLEGISAGLYVGGKGQHAIATDQDLVDQREVLRRSPPDILLTNYRMLDLLLMRPADNPLWRFNQPTVLRYLVLDELHSYDGAQGSDVACLIRRLKDRLQTPRGHLVCVGTSATIGSAGTREPRQLLASFASEVFGEPIGPDAIVTEDRLSAWEAFPDQATFFEDPFDQAASDPESLDPSGYPDPASYLDAQAHLWLGQDARDRVGLGETLGRHAFLRELFAALEGKDRTGGPRDWLQVADAIAASDPAFAALDRDLQWRCLATRGARGPGRSSPCRSSSGSASSVTSSARSNPKPSTSPGATSYAKPRANTTCPWSSAASAASTASPPSPWKAKSASATPPARSARPSCADRRTPGSSSCTRPSKASSPRSSVLPAYATPWGRSPVLAGTRRSRLSRPRATSS